LPQFGRLHSIRAVRTVTIDARQRNASFVSHDRDEVFQASEAIMTVQAVPAPAVTARGFHMAFVVAWFFCLLFYFMPCLSG
jgi:hypothetical protein